MTIEDLKRLKISGWTVLSRMQKYGWVDDSGKEIPWTRWINRKGREEIGQTSFRSAQVSTTGFTAGYYPIAIAVTGFAGVLILKDVRCDVLSVGGGGGSADSIISASTNEGITIPTGGNLYVQATAGIAGITLTLQTAVGVAGQKARIIHVDQGLGGVLVNTTGGQTINGGTSYELTNQWQSFTVESNNANWRVIATAG